MFVLVNGKLRVMAKKPYETWGMSFVDVNDSGVILAQNTYDYGANLGGAYVVYRDGVGSFWRKRYTLTTDFVPWRPTPINNRGEIIGIAHKLGVADGKLFIATPVPEPASMTAFALGLAAIVSRRKRRT